MANASLSLIYTVCAGTHSGGARPTLPAVAGDEGTSCDRRTPHTTACYCLWSDRVASVHRSAVVPRIKHLSSFLDLAPAANLDARA